MDRARLDEALRAGDVDELLRIVDGAASAREWDELERLRARCAAASDAGHQLWPVASRAAYLLALDAPPARAGPVLVDGAGRFAPGPLSEVAAQAHTWADLVPHLPWGPTATVTAHERVLRGDDVRDAAAVGPPVLELPLHLADWEPAYALAEYRPDTADFPRPTVAAAGDAEELRLEPADTDGPDPTDEVATALHDTVRAWVDESNGSVTVAGVRGDASDAIARVATGTVRVTRLEPSDALALLAWAGASGGAHASRKGAARGRFAAWWVAGALTGLLDDWPPDPDELGVRVHELEWSTWDGGGAAGTGWHLDVAVANPPRGRAWALHARDTT